MRVMMDFDPTLTILHGQEDVIEYLERHHGPLPPSIEVQWCSLGMDYTVPPPKDGVYFHPQVLALRVQLSLINFVHRVLAFYNAKNLSCTPKIKKKS